MVVNPDDFEQRGQFWHRIGQPSNQPREWKDCEGCGELRLIGRENKFCSLPCANKAALSLTGSDHPGWKGDDAGYMAIHKRLRRERGEAKDQECIFGCGPAYDWAHNYDELGPSKEYFAACHRCHSRYDRAIRVTNTDTITKWRPSRY